MRALTDMELTPVEEKEFRKHAPDNPIPSETFNRADRSMMQLRRVVCESQRLLQVRREGHAIEVHGCSLPLSRIETEQVFGFVWSALLKKLTYWEHHARQYVTIPKSLASDMQSIRAQIAEYIDYE